MQIGFLINLSVALDSFPILFANLADSGHKVVIERRLRRLMAAIRMTQHKVTDGFNSMHSGSRPPRKRLIICRACREENCSLILPGQSAPRHLSDIELTPPNCRRVSPVNGRFHVAGQGPRWRIDCDNVRYIYRSDGRSRSSSPSPAIRAGICPCCHSTSPPPTGETQPLSDSRLDQTRGQSASREVAYRAEIHCAHRLARLRVSRFDRIGHRLTRLSVPPAASGASNIESGQRNDS